MIEVNDIYFQFKVDNTLELMWVPNMVSMIYKMDIIWLYNFLFYLKFKFVALNIIVIGIQNAVNINS